jgi:hypothetical protein
MAPRFTSGAKLLCIVQALAAGLLVAACGGSSSSTHSTTAPGAQNAANQPSIAVTKAAHDPVTNGVVTHHAFPGTGGGEVNDDNPAGNPADVPSAADTSVRRAPGPRDPCTLVSTAEARSILGKPISTPIDAPLGPTCIYRPVGTNNLITLTVGSIEFAKVRARIHNPIQRDIGGRTAYCGEYGQPTTFVPLARVGTLTITAPCGIGFHFATEAVPRLKS